MALTRGTPVNSRVTSTNTLTVAVDVGSGDRRGLVVYVRVFKTGGSIPATDSVTYNGVALTLKHSEAHSYAGGANEIRSEAWALTNPTSGSNNLVVTLSGSTDEISVIAVPYTDYGGLGTNSAGKGGNLSSFSVTFTTGFSTSEILAGASFAFSRLPSTYGTGVTFVDGVPDITNYFQMCVRKNASGGSDTIDFTITSAVRSAYAAVEVLEDTGGVSIPDIKHINLLENLRSLPRMVGY